MPNISDHIQTILPKIIEIRKKLHQIPELKYEEFETAKLIAETLHGFGYELTLGIAKTGIIAILDSGKPGKTICLRADMDALPIEEPEDNPCRSRNPGKMHACGHDGHCATLLAVAYALYQIKDQLAGKIKFIFQPAEEGGKGSTAIIEAGALENPKVDEIYGYHNWPGLAEGTIATRTGTILVGNGRIEITVHGKPAHTAQPQHAINPVTIGSHLIMELEKFKTNLSFSNALINMIAFDTGEFKRGMAEKAEIVGVYYVDTESDLTSLQNDMKYICDSVAVTYATEIAIAFKPFHSPTVNSAKEANHILNIAKEIYENTKVIDLPKSMVAAEDFSEYLRYVPGCFFLVGSGESAGAVHTNAFQFNDNVISIAANVFCQAVIQSSGIEKHE